MVGSTRFPLFVIVSAAGLCLKIIPEELFLRWALSERFPKALNR